jgi:valine--pyruvate aminotransferase
MDSTTRFARRFVRPTGALELMQDLALAGPGVHMLGGGNPARIPAVEAVYARRLAEIAADPAQFGRFAASYTGPAGEIRFRAAVAGMLADRYGWRLSERNVALTDGSQAAFFTLFNLLAGEPIDGRARRVLLPLSPEYAKVLDEEQARARRHESGHAYSLAEFGLDENAIETRLAPLFERYGFRREGSRADAG